MLHQGPSIEINLAAILRNWQLLKRNFSGRDCAAVVKANAYGLGASMVAPMLYEAGCRVFFVATLDEAVSLHDVVPEARIYVFHGIAPGEAEHFLYHRLQPVLNDRQQMEIWAKHGNQQPAALHVDTGMCRLGLEPEQALALAGSDTLAHCSVDLIMSHLSCAGEPAHPINAQQRDAMNSLATLLPTVPRSLCNSSGIFLDTSYHFHLARPGCSLYGITPRDSTNNPMEHVATLTAPIIQLRSISKDQPVGYGATYTARKGDVLATVEMGYADGFHRILTGRAHGYVSDIRVPVVGRVSMDMVMVDVTAVPEHLRQPGSRIEFIGPHQKVDILADQAQTIGYEIFTGLGSRVRRVYVSDGQSG